ncbi:hypothetical protein OIV83_000298 [Microbotryomycetes sp. JL201]|nr:hypothetical protein OIV83_000298 [Microbotryomycetes sp. JL201]
MIRSSSRCASVRKLLKRGRDRVEQPRRAREHTEPCPACAQTSSQRRQITTRALRPAAASTIQSWHVIHQTPVAIGLAREPPRRTQLSSALEPRPSSSSSSSSDGDQSSTTHSLADYDPENSSSSRHNAAAGDQSPEAQLPPAEQDPLASTSELDMATDFWAQLVKPDNPTREDVDFLKPRRILIPEASSPPSHRTVYNKVWTSALARLDHAFNKSQIATLVTDTLQLNLQDVRLRTDVKRSKRWSNSKALSKWSKKDLCIAIMVLHWNMVDPQMIPPPGISSQVADSIQLSDRTLFLLLEPKANTLVHLTKRFGVKLSFSQEPSTGVLMLNFRGGEQAVENAKTEVELLAEKCVQKELQLPRAATDLRPEVYQAVSRTTKTYLEPSSKPNVISATSTQQRNVDQAELMLASAFADDAAANYTSVFASVPSSFTSLEYALSPLATTCPPIFPASSAPMFARVRQVSRLSEQMDGPDSTGTTKTSVDDIAEWTNKMRIGSTEHGHIFTSASSSLPSSSLWTILSSLLRPFQKELDMVKDVKFDLEAQFGHVAWPLFSRRSSINATTLGPSLDGAWDLNSFKSWKQGAGRDVKSVFLPSPPVGFLASTGLLQRTALPNPFDFLTNASTSPVDLDSKPSFESSLFRRIVYKPRAADVDCLERIEVKTDEEGAWQADRIKQSTVQVMVPTGSSDFQVTLSCRVPLEPTDLPDTSYNSNIPRTISLDGQEYVQSSDYLTRLTTIHPARAQKSSTLGDKDDFVSRVEASHDRRGQSVRSTPLSRTTVHSVGLDRTVGADEVRRGDIVNKLIEVVEKKALTHGVGQMA